MDGVTIGICTESKEKLKDSGMKQQPSPKRSEKEVRKNNLVIIHSETSGFKEILKKLLKWVARSLMTPKKIIRRH